ncbi:hypothetical protein RND71_034710 [Anisodus tanguticus]|uniref:tryptophan synthase n=1 Tax=Anisodus tanguticus TaxID=243964 RepID=A0AAE1R2Q3_9SOLA|nr:hypothetical protein RND71_034710 [Anisodus tanguticus]
MAFSSTVSPKHCRLSSASSSNFPKSRIPLKLNKITVCPSSSSKLLPSIACVLAEEQSMASAEPSVLQRPDSFGRFGKFGGKYVPETLMHALDELESAFKSLATDEAFQKELDGILKDYVGRESPLYFAERLTEHYKRPDGEGPLIYLKREDLNHTGAHKINNAVAQALLAKRLGKKRIIAETGAGQHGVATATVCARFGLECIIYMGAQDMERQALNVFRMKLLGAESSDVVNAVHSFSDEKFKSLILLVAELVRGVHSGTATLKDATSEAIRDWVTNVETTHYILGSVAGPHPYPMMVREFHAVIGKETRKQALEKWGGKPDVLVACVGGGSNAMGLFHEFVDDKDVRLIGVEAAGFGVDSGKHAATLTKGEVGVLHGAMSYLLQDEDGQIVEPHSISAGLDYPGVGPEHSFLKDLGRAEYYSITDEEALEAFKRLSRLEGIIPALETSHALAYLEKLCPTLPNGTKVVLNCSGRGDKDVQTAIKYLKVKSRSEKSEDLIATVYPHLNRIFQRCVSSITQSQTSNGLLLLVLFPRAFTFILEFADPIVAEATLDFLNANKKKSSCSFPTLLPQGFKLHQCSEAGSAFLILEKAFHRICPSLISQGSFLPQLPSSVDLPILGVALERVEKSSGSLVGSRIASIQKSTAPEERHWASPAVNAALQAAVTTPMSDRLKQALRMTPRLLDIYTAIAIREVDDSLLCALVPLYSNLFPEKLFLYEAQKRILELMLAAFSQAPSFIALLKKPIVDRLGEAYDSPTKVNGPSFPSHTLGSDATKFRKSSQSRLLCFIVTAIAKLATYHPDLFPRARVSLTKVARSRISDARVSKRAHDYLGLMNEPTICLSVFGPCESPSKGMQKPVTVNWSEGGTKMVSHLPFYLLGEQEGPPPDFSFRDVLPGR